MKRQTGQLLAARRRAVGTGPTTPKCYTPTSDTGASRWSSPGHPSLTLLDRRTRTLGSGVIEYGGGVPARGDLPARPQARRLHHNMPHTGGIQAAVASHRRIPLCPSANGKTYVRRSTVFMRKNPRFAHERA